MGAAMTDQKDAHGAIGKQTGIGRGKGANRKERVNVRHCQTEPKITVLQVVTTLYLFLFLLYFYSIICILKSPPYLF